MFWGWVSSKLDHSQNESKEIKHIYSVAYILVISQFTNWKLIQCSFYKYIP